jgi:hypothetical protein
MGPSLPGELRSSGVTKIEPIMEDEEQQPAETASIQTTHSVREVRPYKSIAETHVPIK